MSGTSARDLLRLTLTPGLGPVLIDRACAQLGDAAAVARASIADLRLVRGIGEERARTIRRALDDADRLADDELRLAEHHRVSLTAKADHAYPPLLRHIPSAPTILYHKGPLAPEHDRHAVAIVGSRHCTAYGVEQAERFASFLAQSGLVIVSGGARGVDTAAHRATARLAARTIVVLGCGLTHCYPPENADLFEKVLEAGGAIVSELPLRTSPTPDNFPARNRIISGMSLGVLVIEAGKGSGALITARAAAEDQGREVMAVPGRVDSPSSEGVNDLIKQGGAAMVTHPADVVQILESPARYLHDGVHHHRYLPPHAATDGLFESDGLPPVPGPGPAPALAHAALTDRQRALLEALDEPRSVDELARATGLEAGVILAEATMLEIRRVVVRSGNRLARRGT